VGKEQTLNLRLKRKFLYFNTQKRQTSTLQHLENDHSLSCFVPAIHQDFPMKRDRHLRTRHARADEKASPCLTLHLLVGVE
jgi:hypothetical protein